MFHMSFLWNVGWILFQGDNKQPQTAFESIATVVTMQLNLLKIWTKTHNNVTLSITITTVADVCRTEFFALNGAFVN